MTKKTKVIMGVIAVLSIIGIVVMVRITKEQNEVVNNQEVIETTEVAEVVEEVSEAPTEEPEADEREVVESDTWEGGVIEMTEETAQAIQDKEFIEETENPDEFAYQSIEDREAEEYEKFLAMDVNEDGFLSKREIYAEGWTYPIDTSYWLYQYMIDPNEDGIIWEDEAD